MHRDDDVDIAGPRPLGVESRRLRRMVGMAVVVADDVEAGGVCLALDSDLISRVDLIAIASTLDDDVSRALHLGHSAVARWADHDAADLMRIALGAMQPNGLHRVAGDLHLPACRGGRTAKRSGWGRGVTVAARTARSIDNDPQNLGKPSPRRPRESSRPDAGLPTAQPHSNARPATPRFAPPRERGRRRAPPGSPPPRRQGSYPRSGARSQRADASSLRGRGTNPQAAPRSS